MGLCEVAHGWGEGAKRLPLPKILTQLYLTKFILANQDPKKHVNHIKHPFSSLELSIFHQKLAIFIYYIGK